ncbi:aconitase/3-isopropylmalate dehydratase large subunit family protein [Bacteroidota bacterium]
MGKTFVEKILGAPQGTIVFKKPDLVLSHDNSASIRKTFEKMNGKKLADANQLLIVLDHNAPPTNAKLATDYQAVRDFVNEQGIEKFYDAGKGICHQIMSYHARPGMIIVGSDSHTCTAGAFNALAAGIDRTETAGLWRRGETWFRVPESMKITLSGNFREGVYAKDLSLWIIGMIGSAGANYMSIEFHGDGVKSLNISDRMTLANLASEMGAKNAVFPRDEILDKFYKESLPKGAESEEFPKGVWADPDAKYSKVINIELSDVVPLVAAPHHVDNIKTVTEVEGTRLDQGLIGTCTNGRIEDLRIAAGILQGKQLAPGFQLLVIPASQKIYLQAMDEGLIKIFLESGANVLSSSCGPCLGTGQGIPADGFTVISTANRNFKGRMGNKEAEIYLASPATVAASSLAGSVKAHIPFNNKTDVFSSKKESLLRSEKSSITEIPSGDNRRVGDVWNYSDVDNLNTDQMFAGNLTYNILSSDPEAILPHLFEGFDQFFAGAVSAGDIIIAGDNFGCGSSREHPSVGLSHAGVKAVIVKSVNRIFFRSSINQGLPLIVQPDVVKDYQPGDKLQLDLVSGRINLNDKGYSFAPLPEKLMEIIINKGLVNWIRES